MKGSSAKQAEGPRANWLVSRGAFVVCFAVVVFFTIAIYAQERWLAVVMTGLVDGGMVGVWLVCAWGWGKVICRARFSERENVPLAKASPTTAGVPFAEANPPLDVVTAIGIGLGIMGLLALFLGLGGVLNRVTAAIILLVGPTISAPSWLKWISSKRHARADQWFARPAGASWLFLVIAPAVGMMIAGASITPGLLWKPEDPHPYDALEYHLQVPREWYETGKIAGLHHNVYSYFPFGVEMHYLLAMHVRGGAWNAMYQCQFLGLAWSVLTAVAVYGAIGRSRKLLATAGAVLVLGTPWFIMLGSVAYTESALAFYTALTVGWLVRGMGGFSERKIPLAEASPTVGGQLRCFLLPGLCGGLACGVKYTAVPMVYGVCVAAMILLGISRRRGRAWWAGVVAFAVAGGVVASPWLIRNAVWTGNPVFPLAMKSLGKGHFDDVQVKRFEIAHAAPQADQSVVRRVARVGSEILFNWQYGYVIWLVPVAGLVVGWRRPTLWLIVGFAVANLFIWMFATHLLSRFYVLAIPVAAMGLGMLPRATWYAVGGVVAGAVICGAVMVHPRLESFCALARNGLFGLDDLSFFNPPELANVDSSGQQVWLIGDAQGFLYRFPSRQLHYRTVFDIKGDARDMYEGWTGLSEGQVHGIIVLNPMEVERLSKTYTRVPGLPKDYDGPRDRAVILQR